MRLVIIADDLTGAADTGACFADAGLATLIDFGGSRPTDVDVLVISTETRDATAKEAAEVVRKTVAPLKTWQGGDDGVVFYKKIDSGLRGHPRDELLALMEALNDHRWAAVHRWRSRGSERAADA
jgi:uncharacterized protein YgbK (DUF1537 family)